MGARHALCVTGSLRMLKVSSTGFHMSQLTATKTFQIPDVEIEASGTAQGSDHSVGIMSAYADETYITLFGSLDLSALWKMLHEFKKLHKDGPQDPDFTRLEKRVEESLTDFEAWINEEVVKDALNEALNEQANEPDYPDYD